MSVNARWRVLGKGKGRQGRKKKLLIVWGCGCGLVGSERRAPTIFLIGWAACHVSCVDNVPPTSTNLVRTTFFGFSHLFSFLFNLFYALI